MVIATTSDCYLPTYLWKERNGTVCSSRNPVQYQPTSTSKLILPSLDRSENFQDRTPLSIRNYHYPLQRHSNHGEGVLQWVAAMAEDDLRMPYLFPLPNAKRLANKITGSCGSHRHCFRYCLRETAVDE